MEHDTILSGRNLQIQRSALTSYLGCSSTLKMAEALNFSVTSVNSNVLYTEFGVSMFLQEVKIASRINGAIPEDGIPHKYDH